MSWLRNYIKEKFDLYDIEDLQVGGRCGCCGKWMPEEILPNYWAWGLCENCADVGDINNLPEPSHARDLP